MRSGNFGSRELTAADASSQRGFTREYWRSLLIRERGHGICLVSAACGCCGMRVVGRIGNAVEPPPSTQALIRTDAEGTQNLFGVDLLHDTTAFRPANKPIGTSTSAYQKA